MEPSPPPPSFPAPTPGERTAAEILLGLTLGFVVWGFVLGAPGAK